PGTGGDPARVPAHYFDDHDAVKRLRCCVQPVDRFGCYRYRGVKSKSVVGPGYVVVDGFGNSNDRVAVIAPHSHRRRKGSVTADDNEGAQSILAPVLLDPPEVVGALDGIAARGAKYRPALVLEAGD